MITLYAFGEAFGLPDMSPFVTKVETLLKMAGLDYRVQTGGFNKAPKGKLPYIEDDGEVIADSTFIREHLEKKYGIDFDRGLDAEQRAVAWAFEKMLEDHAYWAFLHSRWVDENNFRVTSGYFDRVPMPMRLVVRRMARRQIRSEIQGHGMGRHTPEEIVALGTRSLDAAATFLAEKPFMMSAEPTGLDATVFAFVVGGLCPSFETPLRGAVEGHGNLKRYVGRMAERFFPEQTEIARWVA
ncbi:glutathione S-transferase [Methyloceanibacter superfactus]|uniref:Glutathione S-transferase n=1 Tax=Methyloceanibacter superfactus TaxID=1774969 RepID=A0A1E3WA90_9HYPH|nr:glutathione S-transferase family protein [Methyloceanibacter superfactus]ODS02017.1 glutathione S-transferase [Methyloceanibacter superfactus]